MKKVIVGLSVLAMSLLAVDYSQMSTEELNALRGTVAYEDRDAFRAEMQSRMQYQKRRIISRSKRCFMDTSSN